MIIFSRGEKSDIQEVDGRLVDVFVNEQIRRCVTFLYEDLPNEQTGALERTAVGTAFFISKSLDDSDLEVYNGHHYPEKYLIYVVTAGHVITAGTEDTIYIRLNKKGYPIRLGERLVRYEDFPIPKSDWVFHPKEGTTDVAVHRFKMPSGFDVRAMPFGTLTTKIYTAREGIRSGREVFYVGLFSGHQGMERAEPVIRFGNISLMLPFEKVEVYLSYADRLANKLTAVEAYLA